MDFVENVQDIQVNVTTFLLGLRSTNVLGSRYSNLLAGGRAYYVHAQDGALYFVPSRFLGYRNNNASKHDSEAAREVRHGSRTNAVIDRVLGVNREENALMEDALKLFVTQNQVRLHDKRHTFWITREADAWQRKHSAIDDIGSSQDELGATRIACRTEYVRNHEVRNAALLRSEGACEFCGKLGFQKPNGDVYLETHHIIRLADQGPDSLQNVIALCADHHREAHYGKDARSLEQQFSEMLLTVDV